jgi:hypothetical protein
MRTWIDLPYVVHLGVIILQLYLTTHFFPCSVSLTLSSSLNVFFVCAHALTRHRSSVVYGVPLLFGFPFAFSSFAFPSEFNYAWRVWSVTATLFAQMLAHVFWLTHSSVSVPGLTDVILSEPFDSCSICLEKMERGVTFTCTHTFHKACILLHIKHSNNVRDEMRDVPDTSNTLNALCPLCRTPLTISN